MKKRLWGGRFTKSQDPEFEDFSCSMYFDYRLAKYDALGSIAHAKMLGKCGIIPKKDAGAIVKGLNKILKEIEAGKFIYDFTAEDIHTNIHKFLRMFQLLVADAARKSRGRGRGRWWGQFFPPPWHGRLFPALSSNQLLSCW